MSKKNLTLKLFTFFFLLVSISNWCFPLVTNPQVIKSEKVEKKTYLGLFYVNKMFGNLLKSPNDGAVPLMTVECGDQVKVYESNLIKGKDFHNVKLGKIEGFMRKEYLSPHREGKCFKDRYPKFYDEFLFDEGDKYYWGRLEEKYVKGETKVKLK